MSSRPHANEPNSKGVCLMSVGWLMVLIAKPATSSTREHTPRNNAFAVVTGARPSGGAGRVVNAWAFARP